MDNDTDEEFIFMELDEDQQYKHLRENRSEKYLTKLNQFIISWMI